MCGSWLHSRHLRSAPQRLQLLSRHCAWWEDSAGKSAGGLRAGGHVQHACVRAVASVARCTPAVQASNSDSEEAAKAGQVHKGSLQLVGAGAASQASGLYRGQWSNSRAPSIVAVQMRKSTPQPNPSCHAGRCKMKAAQWGTHRLAGSIGHSEVSLVTQRALLAGHVALQAARVGLLGRALCGAAGQQGRWAVEQWTGDHQVAQGRKRERSAANYQLTRRVGNHSVCPAAHPARLPVIRISRPRWQATQAHLAALAQPVFVGGEAGVGVRVGVRLDNAQAAVAGPVKRAAVQAHGVSALRKERGAGCGGWAGSPCVSPECSAALLEQPASVAQCTAQWRWCDVGATVADYRKHRAGRHALVPAMRPCQASRPARSGASQLHAPLQLLCMQLRPPLVPEPRYRVPPHLAANLAGQVVASQAQVAGRVNAVALEAVAAVVALKVIARLGGEPGGLDNNRHACRRGRSCHRGSPALAPRGVQGIGLREGSRMASGCAGRPVALRAWASTAAAAAPSPPSPRRGRTMCLALSRYTSAVTAVAARSTGGSGRAGLGCREERPQGTPRHPASRSIGHSQQPSARRTRRTCRQEAQQQREGPAAHSSTPCASTSLLSCWQRQEGAGQQQNLRAHAPAAPCTPSAKPRMAGAKGLGLFTARPPVRPQTPQDRRCTAMGGAGEPYEPAPDGREAMAALVLPPEHPPGCSCKLIRPGELGWGTSVCTVHWLLFQPVVSPAAVPEGQLCL